MVLHHDGELVAFPHAERMHPGRQALAVGPQLPVIPGFFPVLAARIDGDESQEFVAEVPITRTAHQLGEDE
jgi:hypothetical protein